MKKSQEPRSSSSCAACKFLKRKCSPNCTFAPYFRSDEPGKFAKVHKVFGASNVSKILNQVPEHQRGDTVNSLVYEAELRLRDPVYGCIGAIASLENKMMELQRDLILTRARLASCYAADDHHHHHTQVVSFSNNFIVEVPECNYGNVEDDFGNFSSSSSPFDHGQLSQCLQ